MLQGKCPKCGIKIHFRNSSVGTLKRCDACGQKFVLKRGYGCGTLLVGAGAVSLLICAFSGSVGHMMSNTDNLTPLAIRQPVVAPLGSTKPVVPNSMVARPVVKPQEALDDQIRMAEAKLDTAKTVETQQGGPSRCSLEAQHATIAAQNELANLLKLRDARSLK